ncbi:HAD family hydrolase [Candidatus Daviesbacteria bacterium]|nr:HAD family hydrolase [Candidatus Daviesbacteria bacterium]
MIKLVAFDWNGTIFSDTVACLESVNQVLKLLSLKSVTLTDFQNHFDVPVVKTYLGLGIPEDMLNKKAKDIVNVFHSSYEPRATKVRTRAYAKQLLEWLSKNNIKSIIFSNHIDEPIKKQLKRLKIEKYFSEIIANSELNSSFNGRNKHEKLKNYLAASKLSPDEVLIVGDTIEEIEIGKDIRAIAVALTGGNCSTIRLKEHQPDYLINSLKEVIGIIRSYQDPNRKNIKKQ